MSKLKPFDPGQALAGKPVVRKNLFSGEISQIDKVLHFPYNTYHNQWLVFYIVNKNTCSEWLGDSEANKCLFMAPVKKTVWVNMYDWDGKIAVGKSETYESEEEAKKASGTGTSAYIGTYPIEIEL